MWKEILEKCEAVIFDLDGTLVDSMWIWRKIDEDYFARFGLMLPEDYQKEIEGLSFYETALFTRDKYMPDRSVEDLMSDWNDMAYEHYATDVPPKEGIAVFLEHLKKSGKKIGIATSNSLLLCRAALENNGLLGYFDAILTGEQCGAGKPCPDVYINTAASLGVDRDKCLVFEDICNGIMAGKRAGMTVVAIYDDYSGYQWEEKCRMADHSIMSYREIIDEIY